MIDFTPKIGLVRHLYQGPLTRRAAILRKTRGPFKQLFALFSAGWRLMKTAKKNGLKHRLSKELS
jgi:hypothetical protein